MFLELDFINQTTVNNILVYSHVDDATAVMSVVLLLFIIPAKPNFWCFRDHGGQIVNDPAKY